jgi:3-oxoacyl-[acyl-carrier protein] reductase
VADFENQFKGKNAVVTGGADGINRAIVQVLADRGAAGIIIADYDADRGPAAAKQISAAAHTNVTFVTCDVSDPKAIESLFETADREFRGKLDILVSGAGICPVRSIPDTSADQWDKTIDINLRGVFLCGQAAYALMRKNHSGKILHVASMAARIGGIAAGVDYAASKGGVVAMTKQFAKVMAADGITVNAIAPGIIRTKLTNDGAGYALDGIPMKRLGEPEEIARASAFLLSEEASYVTGQTLDVNGGQWMS